MCPWGCGSQGQWALQHFPSKRSDIERVMKEQSFEVPDLAWIAPSCNLCIRVTMDQKAYTHIVQCQPLHLQGLSQDAIFGHGRHVQVHLYFSWQLSADKSRSFGHFDLLLPQEQTLFSILLPPDATQIQICCGS